MKLIRLSTFLAVTCAAASGALLFSTAQKVQQADQKMSHLQENVSQEEQAIRVLRAEWDYLNRPDRLENLVRNNLDLEQVPPESVRNAVSELPEPFIPIIPARKPAYSSPVAKAIPAVLSQPSSSTLQTPSRPTAPQSPDNNFKKLLNGLTPAAGDE